MIPLFLKKRLITLGTTRVTRYLLWKHEKRLASIASQEGANEVRSAGKKRSLMKKYVPITVGIGLLGLYISRRIRPEYRKPGSEAKQWEIKIYTLLPLRFFSRVWGTVTSIDLPVFLRPKIYSFYANSFGVNLEECQIQDLTCYRNLSEFFIRPIKEECRPIDHDCKCIVSPADGKVLTFGKVTSCQVEQVKGVTYSLQQFLGKQSWNDVNNNKNKTRSMSDSEIPPADAEANYTESNGFRRLLALGGLSNVEGKGDEVDPSENNLYIKRLKEKEDTELYQFVVYLAPGDYHRFHSPVSWNVNFRRHFQGKLLSVNPAIASWIGNLFSLNERAVYIGSWYHGFFSMAAVGATNVGSIRVQFDPSLRTNQWKHTPNVRDYFFNSEDCKGDGGAKKCVGISKGELFGEFRLGSTIVLIFEAPKNFKFDIEPGQKVKYGQKIGVCC
ncbi:UNVERIFIED_CONTAM: hypothetical protein PYX00_002276 [Menopon gallinae]|uniref:Phosphatidylserine decarboxylase proenzyme, mitochondrial n=1 Tax=Menopon gallinae TaxID=328185 RepID=A0AAW2IG44_9NEOP